MTIEDPIAYWGAQLQGARHWNAEYRRKADEYQKMADEQYERELEAKQRLTEWGVNWRDHLGQDNDSQHQKVIESVVKTDDDRDAVEQRRQAIRDRQENDSQVEK